MPHGPFDDDRVDAASVGDAVVYVAGELRLGNVGVVAEAAVHRVEAGAADEHVVTAESAQRIVAGQPVDRVVARAADERVVAGGAVDGLAGAAGGCTEHPDVGRQ